MLADITVTVIFGGVAGFVAIFLPLAFIVSGPVQPLKLSEAAWMVLTEAVALAVLYCLYLYWV